MATGLDPNARLRVDLSLERVVASPARQFPAVSLGLATAGKPMRQLIDGQDALRYSLKRSLYSQAACKLEPKVESG
jgi:hypothetical protein